MSDGAGVEVGKISIKVTPNTNDFRRLLKRDLDAIEKSLEVEVGVGADTSELRRDVKRATESLPDGKVKVRVDTDRATADMTRWQRSTLGKLQSSMNKLEANVELTANGEKLLRDAELYTATVSKSVRAEIPVDLDLAAGQKAKVLAEVKALAKLADSKATLSIDVEDVDRKLGTIDTAWDRRLAKFRADSDALRAEEVRKDQAHTAALQKLHSQLYEDKHRQRIGDFREELRMMKLREDETRKFITQFKRDNQPTIQLRLDPKFDYQLRQRLSKLKPKVEVEPEIKRGAFERLGGMFKKGLGKIQMPSFGGGINFTGYLVIFTLIETVLAPLVGLVTTALLALPGLLVGIATPIAALMLGMEGLARAAEQLKQPLEDLKAVMSTAVEQQFTPVLAKLPPLFDMLKGSLPAVTQGLASMADSIVNTMTSAVGMDGIRDTVANIAAGLEAAAPGVGKFTDGIGRLVNQLSEKFPGIGDWFTQLGNRFDAWVTKISENGNLSTAFDTLGASLQIVVNMIGQLADKGIEFMADPQKVSVMLGLLQALSGAITIAMSISASWYQLIYNVGQAASQAIDAVTLWAGQFVAAISGMGSQISAAWSGVQIFFSGLWDGIQSKASSMWQFVTSTAAGAAEGVKSTWSTVTGFIQGVWDTIVSGAQSTWSNVVSAFQNLPGELMRVGLEAGQNLVQGLINGIGSLIGSAIAKAQELASGVGNAVKSFLGIHSPSRLMTEYGENTTQGFINGLDNNAGQLYSKVREIMQAIKDVFGSADGIALNFNLGDTVDQMSTIASSAGSLRKSIGSGASSTPNKIDAGTRQQLDEMAVEQKRIDLEKQQLQAQKNQLTDKGAKASIQQQIDDLELQKKKLALNSQELKNAAQYGDQLATTNDQYNEMLQKGLQMPMDFAEANANQLMSDLGMGGGALTAALQQGIGFGNKAYNFYVSNIDEAIAVKNNQINKDSLQYTRR